ncbi:MAG: hypothetical protein NZ809_00750 [Thermodesulfovibrio sp.]|nr:hypothetical protein [Thermodesulfovibrio sp.]
MIRFEELQMRIIEAAKNYLDVYEMATFIEQYTLNKESRLYMTLPELKPPYPITAAVSFSYNIQHTTVSLLEDYEEDLEDNIEVTVSIDLPFVGEYNEIKHVYEEIIDKFSDLDIVLVRKEIYKRNMVPDEEYELVYSYLVEPEDLQNPSFYEEVFFDLNSLLRLIYEKTKYFIDISWYRQDDDLF